ncbi:rod shape-determining protein [Nonomuraea jiangxiensis]|uniref:Rod shape-determining protein MreB n=1 Tax=Nonomuraea jiangxiensis TaxID=633440 RepID=A0A1G9A6E8_9ACTN|nr:rod shape-determining protein [Nonomuraea jiangxiensis]SDK22165.1 rod shape-determining protein MreB [Nonomuraea jiangxiensis]
MSLLGRDLAMDLGTASTRIYVKRKGIVLDEPSAVRRDSNTGKVIGFGTEAADGADDTEAETCWPVNGGLPADNEMARRMIRHFLRKVHRHPFSRPRIVMALPEDATPIAQMALRDMAFEADARGILLFPHALAAALGAGLPVRDCVGSMVIDIGYDSTRIAVVSRGAVVAAGTVLGGGRGVNRAIARWVENEYGLVLDDGEAEAAKRGAGQPPYEEVVVKGHDPDTGERRWVALPAQGIREAGGQQVESIARAAVETVESCPAELAADLSGQGAVLIGGGSLLRGLGRRLRAALSMPVRRAERPTEAVALGLGRCAEELGLISKLRRR